MKTSPFVLTTFLLHVISVSSLSLRAGDKTVVGNLASHESSTPGLVRGRKLVQGKEYTIDTDFDLGMSVNVNHDDTNDQLQLDSEATPFNFIWVPISNLNLVVKVDTDTGNILGTYRTAPVGASGDPSRTTVDRDGSVWVANRAAIPGTIVHIGLEENNQCQDRNDILGIQTSNDTNPLGWTSTGPPGGNPGVGNAEDECIVHYTTVSSCATRHLSIDAANNVWVSGIGCGRPWDLVKGGRYDEPGSGSIIRHRSGFGYGGYGGLTDPSGIIWSSRPLLRWNPDAPPDDPALNTYDHDSYGLCIDSHGNVWDTALDGHTIRKFNSTGDLIGTYHHGGDWYAQGCVVDKKDDVWVAHSRFRDSVGHLKNDGTLVGNVGVPGGPTGVSVDRNGKIWSTNYRFGTLSRIDPNGGPAGGGGYQVGAVDLTVTLPGNNPQPYTYGDMTGSTLIAPPSSGTWSIKYSGEYKWLAWTADTPSDSSLVVEARNSDSGPWTPAQNGEDLPFNISTGYLEVQVIFQRASTKESPVLYDLSVVVDATPPDARCNNVTVYLNDTGHATITVDDIDDESTDDRGIASREVSPSDFGCSDVGPNIVILNVTDTSGNSAQCHSEVTVWDITPPVAQCKDVTIHLDDVGQATITADEIDDGSTDECGIASKEVSPSDFGCSEVGPNGVTLNVTDVNGNSAQCTFTVTVLDELPPQAHCDVGPNPDGHINGANNNGFFTLTGVDNCPTSLYIIDDETGYEFGPFLGDSVNFKWTEAPGSTPKQLDGSGVVDFYLHGQGNATVRVEDSSGNVADADCPATPPMGSKAAKRIGAGGTRAR